MTARHMVGKPQAGTGAHVKPTTISTTSKHQVAQAGSKGAARLIPSPAPSHDAEHSHVDSDHVEEEHRDVPVMQEDRGAGHDASEAVGTLATEV